MQRNMETRTEPSKVRKSAGAFRTISEVAEELGIQQHVLRFWETKFAQVKPLKRGGGRRYYRPEDIELLRKIHHLLYTEGYTIKGVQKLLKGQGKQQIVKSDLAAVANQSKQRSEPVVKPVQATPAATLQENPALSNRQRVILESMLGDLKELRSMLQDRDR